jgi:hypothetical protein
MEFQRSHVVQSRAQPRPRKSTAVRARIKAEVITFALVPLFLAKAASAQTTDSSRPPTLTVERYDEDWSFLANGNADDQRWTAAAKYIPIDSSGDSYLTTGVEARSRFEGYENTDWGSTPNQGYVWHRLMPYADLHVGKVRLFAQPILSSISSADVPIRGVDETGIDLTQAFGEVEVDVGPDLALRVAAGRRLVSLGAGRFIDTRYGPNVPLPFDGVQATLSSRLNQVTGFYLRPVVTRPGDFNDRTETGRAVWGLYYTRHLPSTPSIGADLYYLGFRDRHAVFDEGVGREVVHTFGTRLFGDTARWYWNLEGAIQRGTFAGYAVRSWGGGGEIGRRFPGVPLRPEVGVTTDIISGDKNPSDGALQTFNPLFPRGKYFGALSPIGPRNLIHVRPSTTVHPLDHVAVSLTGVAYWRQSLNDGIYNIPGFLVRSGRNTQERFIGKQAELSAAWQATQELNLSVQLSTFVPSDRASQDDPDGRYCNYLSVLTNGRSDVRTAAALSGASEPKAVLSGCRVTQAIARPFLWRG